MDRIIALSLGLLSLLASTSGRRNQTVLGNLTQVNNTEDNRHIENIVGFSTLFITGGLFLVILGCLYCDCFRRNQRNQHSGLYNLSQALPESIALTPAPQGTPLLLLPNDNNPEFIDHLELITLATDQPGEHPVLPPDYDQSQQDLHQSPPPYTERSDRAQPPPLYTPSERTEAIDRPNNDNTQSEYHYDGYNDAPPPYRP